MDFELDGDRLPTTAPHPKIIWALLVWVHQNHPEKLLYVLLQCYCALRPEEAYRILENPRQWFRDHYLYFPANLSKAQTVLDRHVQLIPVLLAWLMLVPGWAEGIRTDFRPLWRTKPIGQKRLQLVINDFLRGAGYHPNLRVPGESLRKAHLTAMVMCGVPETVVMQTSAHTNPQTLRQCYVDETWTPEMGLAHFSNFPPNSKPHNYTESELTHAYGQTIQ